MTHDHPTSGWPLVLSWTGNGVAWLIGPAMSPLQAIALVLTIGYTLIKAYMLLKHKRPPAD